MMALPHPNVPYADWSIGSILWLMGVLRSGAAGGAEQYPYQPSALDCEAIPAGDAGAVDERVNTSARACSDRQIFRRR